MRADYWCGKCQKWQSDLVYPIGQAPADVECPCGGMAIRKWKMGQAPAIVSDKPYYSEQLMTQFSSKKEFHRHCKANGMEVLGKEEFNRTNNTAHTNEVQEAKERKEKIHDAMEEAYQRVIIGKQPVESLAPIDTNDKEDLNANAVSGLV